MKTHIAMASDLTAHLGARLELPLRTSSSLSGAMARQTARLYLASWVVADEVAQAAVQVIAEYVGNVCLHTTSEYALMVMCHFSDRIRIEVSDFGKSRVPGTYPVVRTASDDDEALRGLVLVDWFSDKWGEEPNGLRGLTRYCEIALAS